MSDFTPLLRAVVESPNDDTIRLIAADWLDERGDPLGEFIRVQLRMAEMRAKHDSVSPLPLDHPAHGEYSDLYQRETKLLRSNWDAWAPHFVGDGQPGVHYTRGFPSQWTVTWGWWLAHHEAILATCPIRNARDGLVRLATWPDFLRHIDGAPPRDVVNSYTLDNLASRWPGVRFETPSQELPDYTVVAHMRFGEPRCECGSRLRQAANSQRMMCPNCDGTIDPSTEEFTAFVDRLGR